MAADAIYSAAQSAIGPDDSAALATVRRNFLSDRLALPDKPGLNAKGHRYLRKRPVMAYPGGALLSAVGPVLGDRIIISDRPARME